ncbi:hypothetical protein DFH09DRAFT_1399564 [Mycena vulgaris]|nr:hypothetical protein DFH09DRAFT_1399564 [Mycena vulgaris]
MSPEIFKIRGFGRTHSFRDIAAAWRQRGDARWCGLVYLRLRPRVGLGGSAVLLTTPTKALIQPKKRSTFNADSFTSSPRSPATATGTLALRLPFRAPQRGSGRSYVGSAGARTLSESSDAPSVRDVITPDARTARSPRLPYSRTMRARSETGIYGSAARVGHVRRRMGVPHAGLVSIGLVVGLDYGKPWLDPYQRSAAHETPPTSARCSLIWVRNVSRMARAHSPRAGCRASRSSTFPVVTRRRGRQREDQGIHDAMRVSRDSFRRGLSFFFTGVVCNLHAGHRSRLRCAPPRHRVRRSSPAPPPPPPTNPHPNPPPPSSTLSNPSASDTPSITAPTPPVRAGLWAVHNLHTGFVTRLGLAGGVLYAWVNTVLRGRVPWTPGHHGKRTKTSKTSPDALATRPAAACAPIAYPAFEPPRSTDSMSSVALTGTNHAEGETVYLRMMRGVDGPALSGGSAKVGEKAREEKGNAEREKKGADAQKTAARRRSHVVRACPAGVMSMWRTIGESRPGERGGELDFDLNSSSSLLLSPQADGEAEWEGTKLVINSQSCMHCKVYDVKVPTQNIVWTRPRAAVGPRLQ